VRLVAVGKRYGLRRPWIVRDVTRDVAAGRLIRFEGPNGSGKSTLLKIAAGVLAPSAGRVTGRPHVGYVPERFPGALPFSALEYLHYMGAVHGLPAAAARTAAEEWLERLGAADYAGSPVRTLSKGMCQKLAIAQAFLARPGLLVLDEAWTGLDQAARGALDAAVRERVAAGGSVLFVDHDPARLADFVMERWRLSAGAVAIAPAYSLSVPEPDRPASSGGPVTIELSGVADSSLARLRGLRQVQGVAAAGHLQPSVVAVTVAPQAADQVLREVLSWDGVHVVAVRPAGDRGMAP
jgi:ABC-type Mn2+/Zn2+ transport system ATPase subunit